MPCGNKQWKLRIRLPHHRNPTSQSFKDTLLATIKYGENITCLKDIHGVDWQVNYTIQGVLLEKQRFQWWSFKWRKWFSHYPDLWWHQSKLEWQTSTSYDCVCRWSGLQALEPRRRRDEECDTKKTSRVFQWAKNAEAKVNSLRKMGT